MWPRPSRCPARRRRSPGPPELPRLVRPRRPVVRPRSTRARGGSGRPGKGPGVPARRRDPGARRRARCSRRCLDRGRSSVSGSTTATTRARPGWRSPARRSSSRSSRRRSSGIGQPIVLPATSAKVDYEAELGVVIGRRCRHVSVDAALSVVAGYLNANDVSARDFQKVDGQWVRAKSCDTFAPMGPWLVTADEVADPGDLDVAPSPERRADAGIEHARVRLRRGARCIAFLTETITLEPGDVHPDRHAARRGVRAPATRLSRPRRSSSRWRSPVSACSRIP